MSKKFKTPRIDNLEIESYMFLILENLNHEEINEIADLLSEKGYKFKVRENLSLNLEK